MKLSFVSLLVLGGLFAAVPAHAAESLDACAGRYVDSLPAVISTSGVWCLRKDLSTAMTSGIAVNISVNNVTFDCNGFRVGGLAAGDGSVAYGLRAASRQNVTVRNCNFRGFYVGAWMTGSGHLVEENRFDDMLAEGLIVTGDSHLVRRNRIMGTGGWSGGGASSGITASADLVDNIISHVFSSSGAVYGIRQLGDLARVSGNTVRGLQPGPTSEATGISVLGQDVLVENNFVGAYLDVAGVGIDGATRTICSGDKVTNFAIAFSSCVDGGGNLGL